MSLFLWNRRDLVNAHKTHTRVVNIVSKKFNLSITSFGVMMSWNPWHVMWQMEFDTWHATLDTLGWCTLFKNSRSQAVTVFWVIIFKASAFRAYAFYKSKCPYVCLSVCSLLRYRLTVFLPQLPEVECPKFLNIQNPWGKVMERSGLTFEHFCLEVV